MAVYCGTNQADNVEDFNTVRANKLNTSSILLNAAALAMTGASQSSCQALLAKW